MQLKNIIKTGWVALGANVWNRRSPLNVMLSVTNHCPSRCNYCNIPLRKQEELTTRQIFSLIDQISLMGCQRLGLWGGEPLVRDDIGEIVDYAKEKNLFVTLDSNGYMVPEKMKLLKNLDHLILALDGPEAVHDLNRERGSFQKVMAAIEAVSGKAAFWTITVLTKHNIDSIDFILDKAREYGFLATFQLLHHNDILGRNNDALLPDSESYRRTIRKLILEKKKNAPIASSLNYLNYILQWPDYKSTTYSNRIDNLRCWAGRLYCNVDTDGSIYPCSLLVDKVKALNFMECGFREAFENITQDSCKACMASCFTEYNYLYSLDILSAIEWLSSMRKTRAYLCKKIKQ